MEADCWLPHESEMPHSERPTIRQRLARLVLNFCEGLGSADLGDADEEPQT